MSTTETLKSVKPEGWDDVVHVGKWVIRFPSGLQSANALSRPEGGKTMPYIRADVSAARIADLTRQLAEAQALIYAARQERDAAEDAEKELAEELRTVKRQLAEAREVKPLEWKEYPNQGFWRADTVIGEYSVGFDDGWWAQLEGVEFWNWETPEDPRSYLGPNAGMLACQADYTARILSALKGPTPRFTEWPAEDFDITVGKRKDTP